MPQPCLACAVPTSIGATIEHPALRQPYTNAPFCGKSCALVHIGDDINDLAVAQAGFDAAAREHAELLNNIEQGQAQLAAAQADATEFRERVDQNTAVYRRWINEQRNAMQDKDNAIRAMVAELEQLRVREREMAERMQALARTMSKLQQRAERADRGEDEEATRSARMRFSAKPSTERESQLPFFAQLSRDRREAAALPRRGLFQTWGEAELAGGNARAAAMEM